HKRITCTYYTVPVYITIRSPLAGASARRAVVYPNSSGLSRFAAVHAERPQVSFRVGATEFIAAVVGALRFAQNPGWRLLHAGKHLVDVVGRHVDRRRSRLWIPLLVGFMAAEHDAPAFWPVQLGMGDPIAVFVDGSGFKAEYVCQEIEHGMGITGLECGPYIG